MELNNKIFAVFQKLSLKLQNKNFDKRRIFKEKQKSIFVFRVNIKKLEI